MYIEMIKLLFPIATALFLGAFCKKVKFVDDAAIEKIKLLLFNIVLPVLLFNSFLFANYSAKFFLYVLVVYIGMLVAFLIAKKVKKYVLKKYNDYFPEMMATWEGGTIGVTLCSMLLGGFGLEQMVVFDFGCSLFLFSIVAPSLHIKDGKNVSIKEIIKMVFSSMIFDSIIAGCILGCIGGGRFISEHVLFNAIYHGIADIIIAPASFLIMFYVGYKINVDKKMFVPVFSTCVYRLIFASISCLVSSVILFSFVPFDKKVLIVLMIAYSLPPSYAIGVLSSFGGKKYLQEYYSDVASLMVVFTLIVYMILSVYALK